MCTKESVHISVTASGSCRSGLSPLISWLPSTPHLPSCLTVCALSSLTSRVIISHFFVLQSCHSDQLLASRPCVSTWLSLSLAHTHTDTHAHTFPLTHTHTVLSFCVCLWWVSIIHADQCWAPCAQIHQICMQVCLEMCCISSALPCRWWCWRMDLNICTCCRITVYENRNFASVRCSCLDW